MIKISVIIPVYKVPLEHLRACFNSLAAQTLQESEFIVVSDGASETECSVCEEFTSKDTRFKFFKRKHAGVSATRNFGIDQVQGEFIAFVDCDDWIDSNMLERCYSFANENPCDIITMNFFITKEGKDTLKRQKPNSTNALKMLRQILIGEIFGGMPIRIIKKKFFNENPTKFSTNIGYCEDNVFWATFLQKKPKIAYFDTAFYHYVQDNENSITQKKYSIKTYQDLKNYISTLKTVLPSSFSPEINEAALIVKVGAMSQKLLTLSEYMSFERTSVRTLILSHLPWITKIYLLSHTILFLLFGKSYKTHL